jgi:hypothetical protein
MTESRCVSVLAVALGFAIGCGGLPDSGETVEQTTSALSSSGYLGFRAVPNGFLNSGPAAVSLDPTTVTLVGRGGNNYFYQNFGFTQDNGATWNWTGYTAMNTPAVGVFIGKPAITGFGAGRMAVAGRGTDARVYVSVYQSPGPSLPKAWTIWAPIPNGWLSRDMAIVFSSPYLYVIGQGGDNILHWIRNDVTNGYDANGWQTWHDFPNGAVNSDVGAAALPGGQLFVAVERPTDNFMYFTKSTDGGSTWSAFTKINFTNSTTTWNGGPALTVSPNGQLNAYATWTQNVGLVLNVTSNDGGATWGTFGVLSGDVTSGPAATSPANGNVQVFGLGGGSLFYLDPYRGP